CGVSLAAVRVDTRVKGQCPIATVVGGRLGGDAGRKRECAEGNVRAITGPATVVSDDLVVVRGVRKQAANPVLEVLGNAAHAKVRQGGRGSVRRGGAVLEVAVGFRAVGVGVAVQDRETGGDRTGRLGRGRGGCLTGAGDEGDVRAITGPATVVSDHLEVVRGVRCQARNRDADGAE